MRGKYWTRLIMDTDIGGVNEWNDCVWMKGMLRLGLYECEDHNYLMVNYCNVTYDNGTVYKIT